MFSNLKGEIKTSKMEIIARRDFRNKLHLEAVNAKNSWWLSNRAVTGFVAMLLVDDNEIKY